MSNTLTSLRSKLPAAIAGLLILFTPILPASANRQGGEVSLMTPSGEGSSSNARPVVRDHRCFRAWSRRKH